MGAPRKPKKTLPKGAEGTGRIIESHPLFDEMYHMLESNFSSQTIVRLLTHEHQEKFQDPSYPALPSVRSIDRWRVDHLPPLPSLTGTIVERKLERIDVKIDLFATLQRQLAIAESRLERHVETEKTLTLPIPGVDKAAETVLKTGELLWRVGQDLGIYPRVVALEQMRELAMVAGSRASAQAFVFQIDGELKTAQQMSDEELQVARRALVEGD